MGQDLRINEKFRAITEEAPKTRYLLITGGRGAAKTFFITWLCSRIMAERHNERILYTRYTMASANDTIVVDFKDMITLQNMGAMFTQKRNDIYCPKTNSSISFRGIKSGSKTQTAKHKGLKSNIFVLDEAEELANEDEFDKIDLSIRQKDKVNLVVLLMNPTNKNHWIYQRWIQDTRKTIWIDGFPVSVSTHEDVTHIHVTYLDNLENLSQSYLKIAKEMKIKNPKKYAHYLIGQWREKAEGVIYEDWEEGEFDESLPYIYALDFGFWPDPLALLKIAVDKKRKRIYIKELIYECELSNEQIHERFKLGIKDKSKPIICDTNEGRTVKYLKARGWRMFPVKKAPNSVIQGIKAIRDYKIIVDPLSPNAKNELDNYVWADKKSDTPISEYNHLMDAKRYGFLYMVNYKLPNKGVKTAIA